MTNASSDDASLTSSGAISTPTANPTAATHSQNSFRPKNKITIADEYAYDRDRGMHGKSGISTITV